MAKKKKTKSKSKKTRPIEEDIEQFDDVDDDAGLAEPEDPTKPRNDVYTGLAALTLIALIGAAVFLYLDSDEMKPIGQPSYNVGGLVAQNNQ